MPLPYRWLTSLMVRYNGSSLLIDCGEGTQIAIKEKGWSFKPIDVICFTHYHGDHILSLIHIQMCIRDRLYSVKELVQAIDPKAFITITQINEVRGRGFTMERVGFEEIPQDLKEAQ